MLSTIIEHDYQFGRNKEGEVLDKMNDFFKDNIKQTSERYDTKDYCGEKYKYELKSRRNKYNAFPTTIIPTDKIKEGNEYVFYSISQMDYIISTTMQSCSRHSNKEHFSERMEGKIIPTKFIGIFLLIN